MCFDVGNVVLFDIFLIGINLCNYCVMLKSASALSLVNDDIENTGSRDKIVFDLLGINVLSV